MPFLNNYAIAVLIACSYAVQAFAEDGLSCQLNSNLNFSATVPDILAQQATVSMPIQSNNSDTILYGCTENANFNAKYKMDTLADLDVQNNLQFGQYIFYKIKSIQGRSSGGSAIEYLVNHAYIAFSLRNIKQTQQINISSESQLVNLGEENLDIHSSHLSIVDAQFYVDALPDNDQITEQLSHENLQINLGLLDVEATPINNTNSQQNWQSTIASRLTLNIAGITFKRPTCVFANQTVLLPTLSTGAFTSSAPSAAGKAQYFDLNLQCNGYLNQRKFSMTWTDNHQPNNVNDVGYLSSELGENMSNVGVQIKNEKNEPLKIGQVFDLNDAVTGTGFQKKYNVQYYLATGKAKVGKVNAQAILMIEYR